MGRYPRLGLSLALTAAVAAGFAYAQDPGPTSVEIDQQIALLAADDLEVREDAYQKLRALGGDARMKLEAALTHADPDVRFAVRRLLEALGEEPISDLRARDDFKTAPRMPLFAPPRLRSTPGPGQDELRDRMRDLEAEMQRFQAEMDAWLRDFEATGPGALGAGPLGVGPSASQSSSMSMQVGPDGRVKVTRKKIVDGQESEESYEADSMEAFRAQYPEVAAELGVGDRLLGGRWGALELPRLGLGSGPRSLVLPPAQQSPDGPTLGVQVRVLGDGDAPAAGMLVVSVVPGSIADSLDVRSGDVIVKVAGRDVAEPSDVRTALEAAGDTPVDVVVLRRGVETHLKPGKGRRL